MPDPASPVRALPIGEPILRPLSPEGLARLHGASLRILAETGVAVGSAGIRDRLAAAGARVEGDRVRLPASLVESALAAAPRTYTLAARDPAWDLHLDGAHGYLSVDGSAAEILDLETGVRRPSTEADLAQVTRLADALPEIAFLWQGVEAGDRPVPVRPLHELRTQFANSRKHVQLMTAVTPLAARGAVELARAVAGGSDALRARPILSSFQVSLSPLQFEGDALEAALVYADAGVPAGFVVMAIGCATAPATPAGVLAQTNAEVLAGVTILETLAPGSPTFYGACSTTMDLRSGLVACGGPEDLLYQAAFAQLARHYRLPSSVGTFAPGAKTSDWQAGLENGLSGPDEPLRRGRHALRGRPAVRGPRLRPRGDGPRRRDLRPDPPPRGRPRGRRRDPRGGGDRRGRPGGQLPGRGPHARPHARAVAAASLRSRHLGGVGGPAAARRPATGRASVPARCWPRTSPRRWPTEWGRSSTGSWPPSRGRRGWPDVPARSGAPRSRAPGPTREVELYAPVKAFLEARGYDVKGEIAGCDLVAVRVDEPPVVVELKLAVHAGPRAAGRGSARDRRHGVSRGPGRGSTTTRESARYAGASASGSSPSTRPVPASRSSWTPGRIVRGATAVARRACSGSIAGDVAIRRPAGAPGRRS